MNPVSFDEHMDTTFKPIQTGYMRFN